MSEFSISSIRSDARTLILGLGQTGAAAARWCALHGAPLRILDTREAPEGLESLSQTLQDADVEYRLGAAYFDESVLQGVCSVVISPGLSPTREPVSGLLALAADRGIEVIGEIELFARALLDMAEQAYRPKVLAVTGTNGKTTVAVMARELAQASGFETRAAGNIGPAALAALQQACEQDSLPAVWVLELSSFQLVSTRSLAPDAAVVLNVTQDHLDWHGSLDAYAAAKARLLSMSKVAIVNRSDPIVRAMAEDLRLESVRSFGRDLPKWVGDAGFEDTHGVNWLAVSEPTDLETTTPKSRRKKNEQLPQRPEGRVSRLMPADALRVRGVHNALNALAALVLVRSLDAGWAGMLHALRDYAGEANRTEFVRSIAGIDFVNDSKGTNVGATLAALQGLGQRVVLIAGGVGKGQDFSVLGPAIREHARAVVLIGRDADAIEHALGDVALPVERAGSMAEAVRQGHALAQAGDAVMLSPACASLDMFRDYVHRGQAFVDAVDELALDQGEVA